MLGQAASVACGKGFICMSILTVADVALECLVMAKLIKVDSSHSPRFVFQTKMSQCSSHDRTPAEMDGGAKWWKAKTYFSLAVD
jgi:hypothetical protein